VHVNPVQDVFGTADLTAGDWMAVIGVASTVLWLEELRKLASRRRLARTNPTPHKDGER